MRELGAMYGVAELLRGRVAGVVAAERRIVGLVAVRAPVPLVLAGVCIEYDHAMIHVAVRHVDFVGRRIDDHVRGAAKVLGIVAAAVFPFVADLQQELTIATELQKEEL